ncbi:hypothetical protein [Ensifer sp. 4252]|uniref:hypothetical protein n=1 Tax=Ensifer sp. 4252 TaxID=3373915 RepID=UPI003D210F81
MRVLLVEDEGELAGALRTALSHHGMVVDHGRGLSEAAFIWRDAVYDVARGPIVKIVFNLFR